MNDDRPTADLPMRMPVPPTTRYSVKRANTEDERSHSPLLERVAVTPRAVRPSTSNEPRWRADVGEDRVTLRGDGIQIELPLDEARRIAETILRGK